MAHVAVMGAGMSGLMAALLLARRGHPVTLFERDQRQAGHDLDRDFFHWHRPRVPQAVQPHALLSPVRAVLRAEAPDVYEDLLARGAYEYHEFDCFHQHPPYRDGDEHLITVRTRRIALEAALAAAVREEPAVAVRCGEAVRALRIERGDPPRVTGVMTDSSTCRADLVLDASGRRSPVPAWLEAAGCRAAPIESHRTGLAYLCRWYRLPGGRTRPTGRSRPGSATPFALAAVFPSDNGVFALNLVVSTADPTRVALTDPSVFEAALSRFPATAAWLRLGPEPLSPVLPMAGLDNRWTALADDDGPIVAGLVGIGDSLIHTNPNLSQGTVFGFLCAQWVAARAGQTAADPTDYHAWVTRTLRPWFDAQVMADRRRGQRLAGGTSQTADLRSDALVECAFDDPVVMRARAHVRHLLRSADEAYETDEVRRHVAAWLAARPAFESGHEGPTQDEWRLLGTG